MKKGLAAIMAASFLGQTRSSKTDVETQRQLTLKNEELQEHMEMLKDPTVTQSRPATPSYFNKQQWSRKKARRQLTKNSRRANR